MSLIDIGERLSFLTWSLETTKLTYQFDNEVDAELKVTWSAAWQIDGYPDTRIELPHEETFYQRNAYVLARHAKIIYSPQQPL